MLRETNQFQVLAPWHPALTVPTCIDQAWRCTEQLRTACSQLDMLLEIVELHLHGFVGHADCMLAPACIRARICRLLQAGVRFLRAGPSNPHACDIATDGKLFWPRI
jgi:hypothetical protein